MGRSFDTYWMQKSYARVTLPAFMHFVHTLAFFTWPSTTTVTFWILGRNTRLVTR